jgi:hypothetical protein
MPGNRFEVQLKTGADPDVSEVQNHIPMKHFKTRKVKTDYRNAMKDPSRYHQTHMADPDHPTIVMKTNEDISFFHSVAFTVGFMPDPEVEPEVDAVICPFEKQSSGGGGGGGGGFTKFNEPQKAEDTGASGTKRFKAGPFRMTADGQAQKFYKFIVWTAEGELIDPDIVFE